MKCAITYIYDKDRNLKDKFFTRGDNNELEEGDYELITHVAIFNEQGEMLIQKRSITKKKFANLWDISAGGHFGNMSPSLVKNYADALGFEYITASNKDDFEAVSARFVSEEPEDKPMIFEIFPGEDNEINNLDAVRHIKGINSPLIEQITDKAKSGVKAFLKKIQ